MKPAKYIIPATVKKALASAAKYSPDFMYFGGGTDIQIYLKQQLLRPQTVIDLTGIKTLGKLKYSREKLELGALVTLDQIIRNNYIQINYPLLHQAASVVATPVIRKTATIGGNLLVKNRCTFYNQSKDWRNAIGSCLREEGDVCQVTGGKKACFSRNVSDTATALIALDARVFISLRGENVELPVKDLYRSDGIRFHRHPLNDGILTRIEISRKSSSWWFKKLRLRKSMDFMSLAVAVSVDEKGRARICLNGVSMSPVLIEGLLADMNLKDLMAEAGKMCKTVDNDLMPLKYRRQMIKVYLKLWWESLGERKKS